MPQRFKEFKLQPLNVHSNMVLTLRYTPGGLTRMLLKWLIKISLEAVSAVMPWYNYAVFLPRRAHPHLALIFTMSQSLPPELSTDVHKQLLAGFDIFHPSRLYTENDMAVAMNVLEGSLDDKSIGPIILCSLQPEHPYVFEFILSCKCVFLLRR